MFFHPKYFKSPEPKLYFHTKYFKTHIRCDYNYTKGKKTGQICNTIVKEGNLCQKHSNLKMKGVTKNIIKVKYNPLLNVIYDPITNLVFKSDTDKMVIGSIIGNKLSDDYNELLCRKMGLRHCRQTKTITCSYMEELMRTGIPDMDFNERQFRKIIYDYFH